MFELKWIGDAASQYKFLKDVAKKAFDSREAFNKKNKKKKKSSKQEGLFKQVDKALRHLKKKPRHPGLETHEYSSLEHPYDKDEKVFEAYAQNNTPGAYRVFWCYGPDKKQITIIAITAHP